jgi:uncharacterized membrane protein (DUF4010 family)
MLVAILPALAAPAGVAGLIALYLMHSRARAANRTLLPDMRSPLDIGSVVRFALLIGGLNVSVDLATRWTGELAVLPLAAVGGLADIDAIILNVTRMTNTSDAVAESAILVAILANMASKSVLAFVAGTRAFGAFYTASSMAAVIAGATTWLLT